LKQILLIDDNPGDVTLIKEVLSAARFEIEVCVALDGEQAQEMLAHSEFKPALIILDLNLPKVTGLELVARCNPTAPVVVFSSSANPTETQRAMDLGVREFVQKPYDLQEFERVITKIIQDWA
jgi:CheY-like chemotaxis protein